MILANATVDQIYRTLRKIQPKGPLVNSEFYVGWITYWGKQWSTTEIKPIVSTISTLLKSDVSFNMYMFHGGSNFGFSAGK